MRLFVTVKTNARMECVDVVDATHFVVAVKTRPIDGKANVAVTKVLARYLGVASTRLTLRSGVTGKRKVFDFS